MAAITFTAVRTTSNTQIKNVLYGATISAGQTLYYDSATVKYKLGDNNASAATAEVKGIALTPGVDSGYGVIATRGSLVFVGATMTQGKAYYAGATAGEIVPETDLASGNYNTRLGVASSATQLDLDIRASGVTV